MKKPNHSHFLSLFHYLNVSHVHTYSLAQYRIFIQKENDEATFEASAKFPPSQQHTATICETPCTAYTPCEQSQLTETEDEDHAEPTPRELLNSFLAAKKISPIENKLTIPWNEALERTKRRYTLKAKQVVFAALDEMHLNAQKCC